GALFLCVGIVYERIHDRELAHLGGIAHYMPTYAAFFLIFVLGSVGLPGLAGFVGEFLVMLGTFGPSPVAGWVSMLAIIIAAGYLLMPEIVVTVLALLMLIFDAVLREKQKAELTWLALLGFVVAEALNLYQWGSGTISAYADSMVLDNFTVFFNTLFLATAIL